MKIFTPAGLILSLAVSVLCHASISLFFANAEVDEMLDGGVQGDVAVIGTSFADMVSKDNMIARAEPEETAHVTPEAVQPEEETVPARKVPDKDTLRPDVTKPAESASVREAVALPSASKPVKATVLPATRNAVQPAPPAASLPTRIAPAGPQVTEAPSLPVVATTKIPHSRAAPPEASISQAMLDTVLEVETESQQAASSEVQPVTQASPTAAASAVDVTQVPDQPDAAEVPSMPNAAAKPVPATVVSASRPVPESAQVPSAKAVSVEAESLETEPVDVAPKQTVPAQVARLQPVAPTDVADASDVAPAAEPGIPAPKARPAHPDDGKVVASLPKQSAEKPVPEKKRTTKRKAPQAAKGEQSKTQRSTRNNSGKSTVTASRGGGTGSRNKAAGNAKASNYPGLVYRKIQRTRQKRVGGRGSVRVRFSVSSSGGLAGISVAKSSGSRKIDQAAVAHIRRAAPFPAPPKGARRSFTIPIDIRG